MVLYVFLASLSIYNAPKTFEILMDYFNLVSLVLLIFIVPIAFTEHKKIYHIFQIFIIAVLLHSVFVIFESLSTGGRAFGLLGVFYVDLAGLALLYSILFFLYSRGFKNYAFGLTSIIILIGLLLSQTRNAWLSTVVAFFVLLVFLFIYNKKYRMKRKTILIVITFFVLSAGSIFLLASKDLNVNVGERLEAKNQKINITENPSSIGDNSLLSRMLSGTQQLMPFLENQYLGLVYTHLNILKKLLHYSKTIL